MNLFESFLAEPINILPQDGVVNFYGEIMTQAEADFYFEHLLSEVDWRCDQAIILGKLIETKRKVAWYGNSGQKEPFSYTYSNTTKYSLPWTDNLYYLKGVVEQKTNETYNTCLLNLYHSGAEGMAWHSDGEQDLKDNGAIASLSFGAERKFSFKHKHNKEVVSLQLKPASLLVMKDETQKHWLHRLPPTKKVHEPRINLTFRTIQQ
ncbi:alpha-ketoglutarate-dependent dioxygenase AlkB [Colwellia sp. 4_MG-2023]|jgi:alkylated DNA repair dioxygenase AlkB|uniref:alpha-ketoglutarate-dependent dioxygenase AlkB family protein n=1 Tax=unclassified Colwellia TaxID=196834 RepID=UPI001C08146A|nr:MULTISPECIES: alpha-ketoglutarate-dependent dioxygenase AlkB [unclassified Colwellia]MBU2924187.1 alpha-ketoglutarate-dependent dioxygenase AlkB [Colwellia sp. C2M11]MDO6506220.1 alpha-ketoglutarate-dependent dioxygenase AlkB [Colwellia sp. 5_MG-2023]MDO6554720.1 alpha-ketoglutarate-dependent dioxygenase AlkB [Colwellia sp. 4_MG-2023]MDO6652077.1 alpha-ketoglutarate-dependent dioxygenase AlkB [Colwellia sp. 3_MG-2023]MDO6664853.1 alpha-ketoglutarate-dependent dioxygenase AlkB [Colwellia sp.